jgi:hypothetical protein
LLSAFFWKYTTLDKGRIRTANFYGVGTDVLREEMHHGWRISFGSGQVPKRKQGTKSKFIVTVHLA